MKVIMTYYFKILFLCLTLLFTRESVIAANDTKPVQKQVTGQKRKLLQKAKASKKTKTRKKVGPANSVKKKTNTSTKGLSKQKVGKKFQKKALKRSLKKSPRKKSGNKKSTHLKAKKLAKKHALQGTTQQSNSKWYWLLFSLITLTAAGAFVFKNEAKRKLAFNFRESDVKRSADAKARTLLKSQPSSKIVSSQIVANNQSKIQSIGITSISPLKNISCELNFNIPSEDHGQPKKKHQKSA